MKLFGSLSAIDRSLGTATVLALSLIAAGCDRSGPAEGPDGGGGVAGFAHNQTQDLSGFYAPMTVVAQGAYRLEHVFIGQAPEFVAWEGGRRSEGFGPIMLEFSDLRSGVDNPVLRLPLLPRAYAVSDVSVRFSGNDPRLGEVVFDGVLDAGALDEARRNLGVDEAPALEGDLTIAGHAYRNLRFTWSMDD